MKNKDYTMFGLPLAALLVGLISLPAWGTPAGKLVAWGNNQYGQTNVPAGNDFVAIDASQGGHALALRSDGSLAGWGWNFGDPVLGTGDIFYGQAIVPAGNDFKAIAAGAFHSLALKSDGSLVGWGWNYGEEASGTGGIFYGQATPPAGTNFVAISAGFEYSLAIQTVIERPVLSIARVGTNVVLSWPANDSGYTLEAKTDLSSSLNWSNVLGTPAIVGNLYTVTNSVASGSLFYRLKK